MNEQEEMPIVAAPPRWGAEIAAAFVKAQGELDAVSKGRKANMGTYSYTYADLASIQDDVRAVFKANDLAHSQDVVTRVSSIDVYTMLVHKSGESVTFGPMTFPAGGTPQSAGSAVTYARRYSLLAALGLATEDDDGQAARSEVSEVERVAAVVPDLAAIAELAERVKNASGDLRVRLDECSVRYGRGISKAAFGADPTYAAEMLAILEGS